MRPSLFWKHICKLQHFWRVEEGSPQGLKKPLKPLMIQKLFQNFQDSKNKFERSSICDQAFMLSINIIQVQLRSKLRHKLSRGLGPTQVNDEAQIKA